MLTIKNGVKKSDKNAGFFALQVVVEIHYAHSQIKKPLRYISVTYDVEFAIDQCFRQLASVEY